MKKNLPVTQRQIDYPDSEVFISKTNTKGIITFVNESFVRVSGFSEDELLGKNHNMVRHPDMPEWAFAEMWKTISAGYPWRGIVKNRAKNGDHYWVKANVAPVTENGVLTEFISLRKKPTRAEIEEADSLYRSGKLPPPPSLLWRFKNLSLQIKIQLVLQPVLLIVLAIAQLYLSNTVEDRMVGAVKERADGIANEIIDSANMLMVTGAISDEENRKLLIKKISSSGHINSTRLVRAQQVVDQYGPGLPEEHVDTAIQQRAIEVQKPVYSIEKTPSGKPFMRVVTPYIVSTNFHGTNCLTCHQVKEGSVNGASDIEIDMSEDFASLRKFNIQLTIGQILLQISLFLFIGWTLKKLMKEPVDEIKTHLNKMVTGDLTSQIEIRGRNEMGSILCTLQSTQIHIAAIINNIVNLSLNLEKRSSSLKSIVANVSENSESQSGSATQVASTMREISERADEIANNASDASKLTEDSNQAAIAGNVRMIESVASAKKAAQAVLDSSQTIAELETNIKSIHGVTNIIREIADQTNLLALNAAIEAARAGEQGRGFAVVADEVRKLAEKTQASTTEIGQRIDEISMITAEAVNRMEVASTEVDTSVSRVESEISVLDEIAQKTQATMEMVKVISKSVQDQATASQEVAANIQRISDLASSNTRDIQDAHQASVNLDSLAQELNEISHKCKL